jgi:hypothetical protein
MDKMQPLHQWNRFPISSSIQKLVHFKATSPGTVVHNVPMVLIAKLRPTFHMRCLHVHLNADKQEDSGECLCPFPCLARFRMSAWRLNYGKTCVCNFSAENSIPDRLFYSARVCQCAESSHGNASMYLCVTRLLKRAYGKQDLSKLIICKDWHKL